MLKRFFKAQKGATAMEYALIAFLVSIGIVFGAQQLGQRMQKSYSNVDKALEAELK